MVLTYFILLLLALTLAFAEVDERDDRGALVSSKFT